MKRSLAHLPKQKKQELKAITTTILEMAPATQMVILFGSYARGDWVEDVYQEGHITYEYSSDYDILVVPETFKVADSNHLWARVERKIRRPGISQTWSTLIVHPIDELNRKIDKGNYFFTDIKKEGIFLFNSGNYRLARIRKRDPRERLGQARSDFEHWLKKAHVFFADYDHNRSKQDLGQEYLNQAAFMLHQATENLYHTLLLVFTGYKPKLHDLEKLGRLTSGFSPELRTVFPIETELEKHRFQLLKRAYVEARYERGYRISKEDLDYLAERVRRLQETVSTLSVHRIELYEEEVEKRK
jgi:uncharacterized protein